MSDNFPKTSGDQAPVGYRPLPGSNNSTGPDLRSLVFATAGIALGIMAGTIFADGSWRSFVPGMPHQPVLASSASGKIASPAAPAQLTQVSASQSTAAPKPLPASKPSPAPTPAAAETTLVARMVPQEAPIRASTPSRSANSEATPVIPEKPAYRAYDPAFNAYAQKVARQQAAVSTHPALTVRSAPTARFVPYVQSARTAPRRHAEKKARARRASWRKSHGKHRLHAHPHVVAARYVPPPVPVEEPAVAPPERFSFTVEGSVTVTNYDPSEGRIQTYEGETFVVDKSNADSNVSNWIDYPADLHYTCNQAWDCTLVHGGVQVVSAKRTR